MIEVHAYPNGVPGDARVLNRKASCRYVRTWVRVHAREPRAARADGDLEIARVPIGEHERIGQDAHRT